MSQEDLSKLKIDKSGMVYSTRQRARPWIWILVLLIIAGMIYFFITFFPSAVEVEVATVSKAYPSQGFTLLTASGYVVAQRKAAVSSKATGTLAWLGVEEGSKVKENQIIARIDDKDVLASREQAAANLVHTLSSLDLAQAELHDAALNVNRTKELYNKRFIARMDLDTAEARYKKAQAGVAGAQAAITAARAALTGAEVAVDYTRIRAPFDGVVLTKDADVGDIVTPFGAAANAKADVVTIADMSSLTVEVDVSESNIEKVKPGLPCEIQLDALPESRFRGAVHMIVPTADRSKASVMVKVRFLERDKRILPEMSARVSFLARPVSPRELQPKTALNQSAIVRKNGRPVAFLVEEDRVREVAVTAGEKIGDLLEIKAGLKAGDKVVINPPAKLQDGARISIKAL